MNGYRLPNNQALAVKRACRTRSSLRHSPPTSRERTGYQPRPASQRYSQNASPVFTPLLDPRHCGTNPYLVGPAVPCVGPIEMLPDILGAIQTQDVRVSNLTPSPVANQVIWRQEGSCSPIPPLSVFTIPSCNPNILDCGSEDGCGVPGETGAGDLDAVNEQPYATEELNALPSLRSISRSISASPPLLEASPFPLNTSFQNNFQIPLNNPICVSQALPTFQFPPIIPAQGLTPFQWDTFYKGQQNWNHSYNNNLLESARLVGTPTPTEEVQCNTTNMLSPRSVSPGLEQNGLTRTLSGSSNFTADAPVFTPYEGPISMQPIQDNLWGAYIPNTNCMVDAFQDQFMAAGVMAFQAQEYHGYATSEHIFG